MEAAISLANLLTKAVNVSNMSKTVCPALQLEIELVEVFRYVRQKHEFHHPLLVRQLWIVLAFFGQKGLDSIEAADKPLQNLSSA